ncbi:MAG TPA: TonB-dependent receptor [Gemmatimonadaceae bacterium]|nr:TonB-dependent receptor [Gemmatimonadaceae bacterium]
MIAFQGRATAYIRVAHRLVSALFAFTLAATLVTAAQAQGGTATGTVAGRVTDSENGQPLQGVTVSVVGTQNGAVTRGDGSFRFSINPGSYQLRARFLGYGLATQAITVTAGATTTADFGLARTVTTIDEVVSTGTRGGERTVTDAPVPVDVFNADDMKITGRTETNQIIQFLAPSFNFPRATIGDGTDHVRPSTLRGLQPDQLLVLINGKRRHTSALVNVNNTVGRGSTGVDLNAIPAASIERVEILRDGAAAQYGSDAIAGVINIILKSTSGSEANGTFGRTKEGDGTVYQTNANYALLLPENGYINVTAEYRDRENTNRTRPDTRPQYFPGDPRNNDPSLTNQINHRQGDSDSRDMGMFLNFAQPLANGVEPYAFGGVSYRRGEAAGFWRRALDDRTVRAIHPNGFLPLIVTHIWDYSGTAGVRGTFSGWRWDLSGVYGRNSFEFNVRNSNNVSLGAASPTEFDAGTLKFNQFTANLDIARAFEIGLSSPLNVAFGGEFRRDGYGIDRGEEASYIDGGVDILDGPNAGRQPQIGAQVFPGFKPDDEQDADRNNVAAYLDLEANVLPQLMLGIAGRLEHYSDFGNTEDGKVALRFEPISGFAIRGAASTGFRAPSLGQSFFSSTATNFIVVNGVNTPFDIRTLPVGSPAAQVLGAEELEPEESKSWSAGLAIQPIRLLSLTADYYHVRIENRIVFSGNFIGDSVRALLARNGFPELGGGRYFTNAVDTRTRGLDVVMQTGWTLPSLGETRLTAGYNRNKTKVTHVDETPAQLKDVGEALFDRTERARIEEGQPRNNFHAVLSQNVRNFGINLGAARYGEVTVRGVAPDGSTDQTFSAKWIADASVSYRFPVRYSPQGATITVGADNIFDEYPDENIPVNSNAGIFPYNGISPFGFNGRFTYLRLTLGL